jgi:ABC-type nitrate/sulfonate/bicarbonate transport system permease component
MISHLPVSDRTRSILRGALAVLVVAACYEATARSGVFARALLPTLPAVAQTLWTMTLDGTMLHHAGMTASTA